jgi:ubiquinone/menaquinone biosynthesis C-methylase UbiE
MVSQTSDTYQFRHEDERQRAVSSMSGYVKNKPEQVKFFEYLMGPQVVDRKGLKVLDACCGIGDLTYFLHLINSDATYVGVDRAGFLVQEAQQNFASNPNVSFIEWDVNDLSSRFAENTFDLTVCKQTLSWLPDYKQTVGELMKVTSESIFISSLFYDGRIDFETRVREYETDAGKSDFNAYYNVYSFPVFREFCLSQGAKEVSGFNFNIEIDLPKPDDANRMGTYTLKLESGERLQISGALLMPWKIVKIDL